MKNINENIAKVDQWIKNFPDPKILRTNDEFMILWVELMSNVLYLLKVGATISRNSKISITGETKHRAIIIGLMVRMTKLYDGFIKHIADRELELALIFVRLISETEVKINYFINSTNKNKTFTSYILSSYKSEKERLKDLKSKSKLRKLIPIEKSMLQSIKARLKNDSISQKKLLANKVWEIDGKNFKGILEHLKRELEYAYVFGGMSHFVHGSWHDISFYHLEKINKRYFPKLEYSTPDPRITSSITILVLNRFLEYLKWNKIDQESPFVNLVKSMLELVYRFDEPYEKLLNKHYLKSV